MGEQHMANPSRADVAQPLADTHYATDPERDIYRLTHQSTEQESAPDEPIKLLEIDPETVPVGIKLLYFEAHPPSGLPFPLIIIDVTPDEFDRIQQGDLPFQDAWQVDSYLPRASDP